MFSPLEMRFCNLFHTSVKTVTYLFFLNSIEVGKLYRPDCGETEVIFFRFYVRKLGQSWYIGVQKAIYSYFRLAFENFFRLRKRNYAIYFIHLFKKNGIILFFLARRNVGKLYNLRVYEKLSISPSYRETKQIIVSVCTKSCLFGTAKFQHNVYRSFVYEKLHMYCQFFAGEILEKVVLYYISDMGCENTEPLLFHFVVGLCI